MLMMSLVNQEEAPDLRDVQAEIHGKLQPNDMHITLTDFID